MKENTVASISRLEQILRTVDDAYALPREGARFCHALVAATGARRIVEIGTGYGYSTIWMAAALSVAAADAGDGRNAPALLITIDRDERKVETAREAIDRAGLSALVRFEVGHAMEVLERLEGPVDFVLSDADKEHCRRYVELLLGKMRPRGVIVTDNIETHAVQLSEFLRWIRGRSDFFSTPVMVGNGMEMSVRV